MRIRKGAPICNQADSTLRYSQTVFYFSIDRALCCLISEVDRKTRRIRHGMAVDKLITDCAHFNNETLSFQNTTTHAVYGHAYGTRANTYVNTNATL